MVSIGVPTAANEHLEHLGEIMERRGWRVTLTIGELGPVLTVTDPDVEDASERIVCRQATDGTWHYQWGPDRNRLCSVARASFAAGRIHHELRGERS